MARSIVLGNGSVLVCMDEHGQIKDFYYDYVGLENHLTEEAICKVGVFADGEISWLDGGNWQINIDYRKDTLASRIKAINYEIQIELDFLDLVYNERPIFIRNITVHNMANTKRNIKVFLNHQFRMYGSHKKDTVYFDPADNTIVHYKGRRLALIGGKLENDLFQDFTVGLSEIGDREGTWRDAEDGQLSKNAIEHGTVDSTISFEKVVDTDKGFKVSLWVCMGKTLQEVKQEHNYVLNKTAQHLTESTQDYWKAWLKKANIDFNGLKPEAANLFQKSLLIIRTHVDNNGGILASGDSYMLQYGKDNYNYVWHRDGAFVAMALDAAGYHEVARKFFEYSNDTITQEGYFFHKYRPDKSLGSSWHEWITPDGKHRLPIQEDETALVISALWKHYEKTKDIEFIESIYNTLIKRAADFMVGFRSQEHLPSASFDLWERLWGIHTFTVATVYDALLSAGKFAELLGKEADHERYLKAAQEIKKASVHLYNEKLGYFYKYIDYDRGDRLHDVTIDISSFYGAFKFGLEDINSKKFTDAHNLILDKLVLKTDIGGVARFEDDEYYRLDKGYPGNPWIVTTLWLAQIHILAAKNKNDLKSAQDAIDWVTLRAWTSGVMPEQVNPYTGMGMSATPLTWSHAEFVTTVIMYLDKLKELR